MPTLREARIARLWSQDALARESGVSKRTIANIETGERVPRLATMRRLTDALGVDWREVDEFRAAVEGAGDTAAVQGGQGGARQHIGPAPDVPGERPQDPPGAAAR